MNLQSVLIKAVLQVKYVSDSVAQAGKKCQSAVILYLRPEKFQTKERTFEKSKKKVKKKSQNAKSFAF